jgi:hypothetical protein
MSDYLVSLLRTAVPTLWGSVLAFLVGKNVVDAETAAAAGGTVGAFLLTATIGGYYALVRLAEPYLLQVPGVGQFLVGLLLGSTKAPEYAGKHSA